MQFVRGDFTEQWTQSTNLTKSAAQSPNPPSVNVNDTIRSQAALARNKLIARPTSLNRSVSKVLSKLDKFDIEQDRNHVGMLKRCVRQVRHNKRLADATALLAMIAPGSPIDTKQNQIAAIRARVGLDHLAAREFYCKLAENTHRIACLKPELSELLDSRVPSVDYILRKLDAPINSAGENNEDEIIELRESLINVLIVGYSDRNGSTNSSTIGVGIENNLIAILDICADRACEAVLRVLEINPRDAQASTNFMSYFDNEGYDHYMHQLLNADDSISPIASRSIHDADNLWEPEFSDENINGRLVVVHEYPHAEHEGFWLPIARSKNKLPGAVVSHVYNEGSSVYKKHMPNLMSLGYDRATHAKWSKYMRENFSKDAFLSIPYNSQSTGLSRELTPLVFNVNLDLDRVEPRIAFRGLHKEWLADAAHEAKNYLEIAFYTLKLMKSFNSN